MLLFEKEMAVQSGYYINISGFGARSIFSVPPAQKTS